MPKILIVDDNRDILLLLRMTFEGAGHEVFTTEDPFCAVSLIKKHDPDALVLDIMMPGLSGWDVLEELRRRPETRSLPILLLTALSDVTDRVRGLRGGADDYQVKPFEPEEILARVEGLISRRMRMPQTARAQAPKAPAESESLEASLDELEIRIAQRRELRDLRFGRYEVREVLGRGAMGTVLRGFDPKLRRAVALKTLRFHLARNERGNRLKQVSRLLEEAVTNARINHPNIVTVYDVGDQGRAAFIAMELVEGTSLDSHLEAWGKLPAERVIPLAAAVARALTAAHQKGVIHRDIKPGNVLLGDDGAIKVTDFGISELLSRATATTSIFGTPGYLSPESLTGDVVTPASDLFSLGVTLYECLSGKSPFVEKNWRKTLQNTVTQEPPPLEEIVPNLPLSAAQIVRQLLAKEPKDRPENAGKVAEIFDQLASQGDLVFLPAPPPGNVEKRPASTTSRSLLISRDTLRKTVSLKSAVA